MDAITGMTVIVEGTVDAPPERVFDLLADVTAVPRWSPECVRTQWLAPAAGPEVGARFVGVNRNELLEWEVTCQVVECDRPRRFGWVVLDDGERPDRPSSRWRYELCATDGGGTRVRGEFVHGPGDSKLRWLLRTHPEWPTEAVVQFRREQLRENMATTMAALAEVAEAG